MPVHRLVQAAVLLLLAGAVRLLAQDDTPALEDVTIEHRRGGDLGLYSMTLERRRGGDLGLHSVTIQVRRAVLGVATGPASPASADVTPGSLGVPVLQVSLRGAAPGRVLTLSSLRLAASGSLDDPLHVAALHPYVDENADGAVQAGEAVLATTTISADNGVAAFEGLSREVTSSQSVALLITADLGGSAPPGGTFALSLASPADVQGLLDGTVAIAGAGTSVAGATFAVRLLERLQAGYGLAQPSSGDVPQASTNVTLLQLRLTRSGGDAALSLTRAAIRASGTGDERGLAAVRLVEDANSNGVADASEPVLSSGRFQDDDGLLGFEGFEHAMPSRASSDLVVVYDLSGVESYRQTFALTLESVETASGTQQVGAEGLPIAGREIRIDDVRAPAVTIDSPEDGLVLPNIGPLEVRFHAEDEAGGSGVLSVRADLDGLAVADGQVLDLATLTVGAHRLVVIAMDRAANRGAVEASFTVEALQAALQLTVDRVQAQIDDPSVPSAAKPLLADALDLLVGNGDGRSGNGAIPLLNAGDLVAAFVKIQAAERKLRLAEDKGAATEVLQAELADFVRRMMEERVAHLEELLAADPSLDPDGKIVQVRDFMSQGEAAFSQGAYETAVYDFRQAQQRVLELDHEAPDVAFLDPARFITNDTTPRIRVGYTDKLGLVRPASVRIFVDGVELTASAQVGPYEVVLDVSAELAAGLHPVRVIVSDSVGNVADVSRDLRVDLEVPRILFPVSPETGATRVPIDSSVVVRFSEPVLAADPSDIVALLDPLGNRIEATVTLSEDGTEATLVPMDLLPFQSDLTISVPPPGATFTDLAGNVFDDILGMEGIQTFTSTFKSAGEIVSVRFTQSPASVVAGVPFTIEVEALDRVGNPVRNAVLYLTSDQEAGYGLSPLREGRYVVVLPDGRDAVEAALLFAVPQVLIAGTEPTPSDTSVEGRSTPIQVAPSTKIVVSIRDRDALEATVFRPEQTLYSLFVQVDDVFGNPRQGDLVSATVNVGKVKGASDADYAEDPKAADEPTNGGVAEFIVTLAPLAEGSDDPPDTVFSAKVMETVATEGGGEQQVEHEVTVTLQNFDEKTLHVVSTTPSGWDLGVREAISATFDHELDPDTVNVTTVQVTVTSGRFGPFLIRGLLGFAKKEDGKTDDYRTITFTPTNNYSTWYLGGGLVAISVSTEVTSKAAKPEERRYLAERYSRGWGVTTNDQEPSGADIYYLSLSGGGGGPTGQVKIPAGAELERPLYSFGSTPTGTQVEVWMTSTQDFYTIVYPGGGAGTYTVPAIDDVTGEVKDKKIIILDPWMEPSIVGIMKGETTTVTVTFTSAEWSGAVAVTVPTAGGQAVMFGSEEEQFTVEISERNGSVSAEIIEGLFPGVSGASVKRLGYVYVMEADPAVVPVSNLQDVEFDMRINYGAGVPPPTAVTGSGRIEVTDPDGDADPATFHVKVPKGEGPGKKSLNMVVPGGTVQPWFDAVGFKFVAAPYPDPQPPESGDPPPPQEVVPTRVAPFVQIQVDEPLDGQTLGPDAWQLLRIKGTVTDPAAVATQDPSVAPSVLTVNNEDTFVVLHPRQGQPGVADFDFQVLVGPGINVYTLSATAVWGQPTEAHIVVRNYEDEQDVSVEAARVLQDVGAWPFRIVTDPPGKVVKDLIWRVVPTATPIEDVTRYWGYDGQLNMTAAGSQRLLLADHVASLQGRHTNGAILAEALDSAYLVWPRMPSDVPWTLVTTVPVQEAFGLTLLVPERAIVNNPTPLRTDPSSQPGEGSMYRWDALPPEAAPPDGASGPVPVPIPPSAQFLDFWETLPAEAVETTWRSSAHIQILDEGSLRVRVRRYSDGLVGSALPAQLTCVRPASYKLRPAVSERGGVNGFIALQGEGMQFVVLAFDKDGGELGTVNPELFKWSAHLFSPSGSPLEDRAFCNAGSLYVEPSDPWAPELVCASPCSLDVKLNGLALDATSVFEQEVSVEALGFAVPRLETIWVHKAPSEPIKLAIPTVVALRDKDGNPIQLALNPPDWVASTESLSVGPFVRTSGGRWSVELSMTRVGPAQAVAALSLTTDKDAKVEIPLWCYGVDKTTLVATNARRGVDSLFDTEDAVTFVSAYAPHQGPEPDDVAFIKSSDVSNPKIIELHLSPAKAGPFGDFLKVGTLEPGPFRGRPSPIEPWTTVIYDQDNKERAKTTLYVADVATFAKGHAPWVHFDKDEVSPPVYVDIMLGTGCLVFGPSPPDSGRPSPLVIGRYHPIGLGPGPFYDLLDPGPRLRLNDRARWRIVLNEPDRRSTTWLHPRGVTGARRDYFAAAGGGGRGRTIYWHSQIIEGKLYVQYWFHYPMSFAPLPAFLKWWHDGDWEMAQIRLDPAADFSGLKPTRMTTAMHHYGITRQWEADDDDHRVVKTAQEGFERPHVYIARGSHATYPLDGWWVAHVESDRLPVGAGFSRPMAGQMTSLLDMDIDMAAPAAREKANDSPLDGANSLVRFHELNAEGDIVRWKGDWGGTPGPLYRNAGSIWMMREPDRFEKTYEPYR